MSAKFASGGGGAAPFFFFFFSSKSILLRYRLLLLVGASMHARIQIFFLRGGPTFVQIPLNSTLVALCFFFQETRTSIAKKPYIFVNFQGGGGGSGHRAPTLNPHMAWEMLLLIITDWHWIYESTVLQRQPNCSTENLLCEKCPR